MSGWFSSVLHPGGTGRLRSRAALAILLGLLAPPALAQTISNTGSVTYQVGATGVIQNSNTVSVTVVVPPPPSTPADVRFFQYAPGAPSALSLTFDGGGYGGALNDAGGASFTALPAPAMLHGHTINLSRPVAVQEVSAFHAGEPVFIVLTDANRNTDPALREFINLTLTDPATGDTEILRLQETGPDTGVFAAAIQSAGAAAGVVGGDGRISVAIDTRLLVDYADPGDPAVTLQRGVLVDPFGIVFDALSGAPVSGATVAIISADTGLPAAVYCDDGVSRCPDTFVTSATLTTVTGVGTLPPGGYRFPFVQPGNYRIVVSAPSGYVTPSTVCTAASCPGMDPGGQPYSVTAGSFGDTFVVPVGPALNIDVPADPQATTLLLQKAAARTEIAAGEFLQYRLALTNRDTVDATSTTITDTLPAGFRYEAGSLRIGGVLAADPVIGADGRTLSIPVGTLVAGTSTEIHYVVQAVARQPTREAVNVAVAGADGGVVSNPARAAVRVREPFFSGGFTLIGRIVDGCAEPARGIPNARLVLDDGSYVATDRDGLYHFEGVRPGTHVVQLDVDSLAPGVRLVPQVQNTRFAGRANSQFVEAQGGTLWRADFHVCSDGAPAPTKDGAGVHPGQGRAVLDDAEAAGGKTDWLAGAPPGVEWLFPREDHNPRTAATRIVIKHAPRDSVVLEHGGGEGVSPLNFEGTRISDSGTVAVSVWRGVPLADGDNRFRARVVAPGGGVVRELERVVRFSNAPVRAELVPEASMLVADGIRPPTIAVRILDRDGKPVRAGVSGGYRLNPPFVPRETLAQQQQRQLAGLDRFTPTWVISGDDGVAYIELQPTTDSGEAVLNFEFQGMTQQPARRQELRTWIAAAPRDWLLVGFVAGTVGYNTLRDNASALPAGTEEETYTDGQASLFAKGRVLGEWLLTLAYDSDKPGEGGPGASLLSTIDPNEYYTLYGDGVEQRYDAPSQDKLYLKLERRQFYALFGDYDSGMTVTQLSRYSRTLNGVKTELGGGPLVFKAFAAETAQNFARDELRGDGTSGLYRLSRRGLVLNGEKVRIETRDRLRSEGVVASRLLTRHIDYDIDYTNGTLFFREPIPSRDAAFNPVYIVAEYETFGAGEPELNAGGRVGVNAFEGRLSAGLSAIREEQFAGQGDLSGIDVKLKVDPATELRFEGATSDSRQAGLQREGDAYLAELEHHRGRLDVLGYARRQDGGFGLNQQNAAEAGIGKLGADLGFRISPVLSLQGQAFHQENLASDATRDVANTRLQYRNDRTALSAGLQAARDQAANGETFASQQALLGASHWLFDRRLELSGNADVALGDSDSSDFPQRFQAGAAYSLTPDVRLILTQEYTDAEAYDTTMTRAGLQAVPWQGARLTTTLGQGGITEYGPRTYAQMGLAQSLVYGTRWGADFSVDSSRTLDRAATPAFVFNPNQAAATGGADPTEDFIAVSGGLTYRSEAWSWNGRAEVRDGSTTERLGLTTGFLRQARAGVAFTAQAQLFATTLDGGAEGRYGSASLAWAWRPLGSHWAVLDRLEYRHDELSGGSGTAGGELFGNNTLNVAGDARSRRLVNNFNLNRVSGAWTDQDRQGNLFQLQQRNQWSLYYGSKYAFDQYDGVDYSGYTDLLGVEVRHDVKRWLDIGFQASALHAWKPQTWDYSFGPQVGFTPFTNGWFSIGYNVLGFHDRDFEAARYTAEGPYLKLRFKFDQGTRLGPDRASPRVVAWDASAVADVPETTAVPVAAAAVVPADQPTDAEAEPVEPAVAPAARPRGQWTLSPASLIKRADAEEYAARLRAAGFDAGVLPVRVRGRMWYRVVVRRFDSPAEARAASDAVRRIIPEHQAWVPPKGGGGAP